MNRSNSISFNWLLEMMRISGAKRGSGAGFQPVKAGILLAFVSRAGSSTGRLEARPTTSVVRFVWCVIAVGILQALSSSAATYNVGSIADLTVRINSAVAGDIIVVSNGVYTTSASLGIACAGTAANRILIRAETVGGVEINGTHGFSFNSGAAYVTVQGFKFTHAAAINMSSSAHHCRLTRNVIELTIPSGSDVSYINISGDDMEVDRNELRNKSTLGEMLDITGSGSQVARRLWVHHNYFHDFTSPGGNGAETIRWGLSGLSLSTGNGLCEHNLFVRCDGENEMISNKSSGNTYRYNTVIDAREISQRHGNDCLYYGNYMRNSEGIRVYGDRHKIFANYFESNSIGVNMGNGDGDVYNGALLTAHDRPDDNVVAFNTFINNSTHYQMGGRTGGLGSSNTVVANNIFQGGGSMASISSSAPYTGSWTNNIRWNTSSAGNMPASAYTTINPLLGIDATGTFHIASNSPAINAGRAAHNVYGVLVANTNFPLDMDAQTRDANPDIGADEFSTAPVAARMLTTNDVGPVSGLTNYAGGGPIAFEAETLTVNASGASTAPQIDANNSAGIWLALLADGVGDYIEYTLPNIPAGVYQLNMAYKAHPNRGVLNLAVNGNILGSPLDQYANPPMYPEASFGPVTLPTTGNQIVRLTVMGKNAAAGAFTLSADKFTLIPLGPLPPPELVSLSFGEAALIITGANGFPASTCYLLASTNLSLPLSDWPRIATNVVGPSGGFSLTNPAILSNSQQFFVLQSQ